MSFAHKKSLGQNFLNNPHVPRRMCEAGNVKAGDTVLEIGPGTGALTRELLSLGAIVKAVEADDRAIATLTERYAEDIATEQLALLKGDMRELSGEDVAHTFGVRDHQYKLIANIPYYLSGHLFRTFLAGEVQPHSLVFLVQKEVAERVCNDKKSSLLSLSVAAFGTPTYICTVKRGNFTPPPRVDSAIVSVTDIGRTNFANLDPNHFFSLLHLGFGQKRKQLRGNLCEQYQRSVVEDVLNKLALPLTVRAEDLDLIQWLTLSHTLQSRVQ